MWFCSVAHTASYPTGSVSEEEHHAWRLHDVRGLDSGEGEVEGPADCSDSERRPLVVSLLDTDANMTAAVKYVGSDGSIVSNRRVYFH